MAVIPRSHRFFLILSTLLLAACSPEAEEQSKAGPTAAPESVATEVVAAKAKSNDGLARNAYFGDTHVHTGWSADAGLDGAVTTPEDAYRLAIGKQVTSNSGLPTKLHRPYDWFMITDHSDGMGVVNEILAGNPEMMESEVLKGWYDALNSGSEERAATAKNELVVMQSTQTLPTQVTDPKWMKSAWTKTVQAAEDYNRPGEFTTFIAYEWTVNADGGNNLHRNVIFRDGADRTETILPLTTFQTQDPEKLWEWMANYEKNTGGQVLAIPHNGNLSNGRMFEESRFDGSPMTAEWAATRQKYERLYEITQVKGQSESHPSLSPTDEFADWDRWDQGNLIVNPKKDGDVKFEYWREALKSGMRVQEQLGFNPFKYGANGGTDTHTGLSTAEENNFYGKFKTLEPSNVERWDFPVVQGPKGSYMGWEMAAAGVTGIWASENTREALWDAMYRRETFATTGPRMKVRFFGGFGFDESDLEGDVVATGYSKGVAMGSDLSAASAGQALSFVVIAMKDPEGANLDRVQIVKGWVDVKGETHEKIFDVAWSDNRVADANGKIPPVGNTVNLETAKYENTIGATEFSAVFTDPDFDAGQKAMYYVRLLEIPTPRWTLYDKVMLGSHPSDEVPLIHVERAFSSPIWYTP